MVSQYVIFSEYVHFSVIIYSTLVGVAIILLDYFIQPSFFFDKGEGTIWSVCWLEDYNRFSLKRPLLNFNIAVAFFSRYSERSRYTYALTIILQTYQANCDFVISCVEKQ